MKHLLTVIVAILTAAVLYIAVQVHQERVHRQKAEAYAACLSLYELHNDYVNHGQTAPADLERDLRKCEAK